MEQEKKKTATGTEKFTVTFAANSQGKLDCFLIIGKTVLSLIVFESSKLYRRNEVF